MGGKKWAPGKSLEQRKAEAFDLVVARAVAGARCPENDEVGSNIMPQLARDGKIKIKVYALNWRVVTIMEGPHAGKTTMPAPAGQVPYRIIYKDHIMMRRRAMP